MVKYNYIVTDWKATLKKCPHCNIEVNITGHSKSTKQQAISQVFTKFIEHHHSCSPFERKPLKKAPLKIVIWSQDEQATTFMSKFQNELILI